MADCSFCCFVRRHVVSSMRKNGKSKPECIIDAARVTFGTSLAELLGYSSTLNLLDPDFFSQPSYRYQSSGKTRWRPRSTMSRFRAKAFTCSSQTTGTRARSSSSNTSSHSLIARWLSLGFESLNCGLFQRSEPFDALLLQLRDLHESYHDL